jgi:hypothetical protein
MEGLHSEAGYMTASVPKRVDPLKSPLTARAGPYMYLRAIHVPFAGPLTMRYHQRKGVVPVYHG